MDENGKLSVNGGEPYKSLVTDGEGTVKWEDRLAYEHTEWKDFTLSSSGKSEITGFTMPPVGDTVTVKVNGVESVETVKSAEINIDTYSYIGSVDFASLMSGNAGWCIAYFAQGDGILGIANPETTVSLLVTEVHKIDEKYIQQDKDFVRLLSYYISGHTLFKHYYKESGEEVTAYKCDNIKHLPRVNETLVYDLGDIGLGSISTVEASAFFIGIYILSYAGIKNIMNIYGTDETEIAKIAALNGYTLDTKPTT